MNDPSLLAEAVAALARRHSWAELGRKLGCSEAMVRAVGSGARRPGPQLEAKLLAIYQIGSSPSPAGPSPTPSDPVSSTTAVNAKATASATVRRLERELDRLDADPTSTSRERTSVAGQLTGATRLLAKLSGSLDVTKGQILRSPHWEAMTTALAEALAPWPDATDAAARALRKLEGDT